MRRATAGVLALACLATTLALGLPLVAHAAANATASQADQTVMLGARIVGDLFKAPHKEAGFRVLEAPDASSALIELGYLTNPTDVKHMMEPAWQRRTAESMVRAIDDYFRTRSPKRGIGQTPAQDRGSQ